MQVELAETYIKMVGAIDTADAVIHSVREGLLRNKAILQSESEEISPDILLICLPLLPSEFCDTTPLRRHAEQVGASMALRGRGRIVILMSALAGLPARRHPEFSMQMAAMLVSLRTLAMRLAPYVLVNGIGVGAVGNPLVAGDAAMVGHASVRRPGCPEEVANAVLFLCDPLNTYLTGQMLSVDGGWSVGYGRSF